MEFSREDQYPSAAVVLGCPTTSCMQGQRVGQAKQGAPTWAVGRCTGLKRLLGTSGSPPPPRQWCQVPPAGCGEQGGGTLRAAGSQLGILHHSAGMERDGAGSGLGRGWRGRDVGREGKNAGDAGHSGSRSGSFIADMQEESPCSTKICLYTNFFVTFSVSLQ